MEKSQSIESVIGLEVHVQLSTQSKVFCSDDASYGGEPNTHVSSISLAHPGTLPMINEVPVRYAVKLGLALGCSINRRTYFDRKHYFYADLPKGFQTTQDGAPICLGGMIDLAPHMNRKIRIHHIHMEEDAGKSIHDDVHPSSLVDFNRAGVPLLEMVTEPDFRSSEEVYLFINQLRRLVRYLGISDGNMEEGSLRCDCNISVRPLGYDGLNQRCEVKNVNSARYARKAIDFEIDRQSKIMLSGGEVKQETREFIPDQGITKLLRGKEDAHDYRYFPEPDLPPILMSSRLINDIKASIPMLPGAYFALLYDKYHLDISDVDLIIEDRARAEYFTSLLEQSEAEPKVLAKLFVNKIVPYLEQMKIAPTTFPIAVKYIDQYLRFIAERRISASVANQKLWPALLDHPQNVEKLVADMNLGQTNDSTLIIDLVKEVIDENPEQVAKYMKGKKGVVKYFMGQLMRKSKGKANPGMASQTIEQILTEMKNQ